MRALGAGGFSPMNDVDPEKKLDAELIERVGRGDQEAFSELYGRFAPGLYSMALKIMNEAGDAQDALQDAFAHIWRKAATYDRARSSGFTWAVMVLRNKSIDRLRMRQRASRIAGRAAEELSTQTAFDDASAGEPAMREVRARVRAALTTIPTEQQQAVELAFFTDLTHEQIAAQLGAPLGTIKARIRRGMLKLRDLLKGDG